MTLTQAFGNYIESLGIATLGQDLILGRAPTNKEVADDLWWIIKNGGSPISKNQTGETRRQYSYLIYRRGRSYRTIEEEIELLEDSLDCDTCTELEGFDTIDIQVETLGTDDDLDSEDRKVGLLQATITTYKECQ